MRSTNRKKITIPNSDFDPCLARVEYEIPMSALEGLAIFSCDLPKGHRGKHCHYTVGNATVLDHFDHEADIQVRWR